MGPSQCHDGNDEWRIAWDDAIDGGAYAEYGQEIKEIGGGSTRATFRNGTNGLGKTRKSV